VKRRTFIAGLGGAAAWPLMARGQQPSVPLVAVLDGGSPATKGREYGAFRNHLNELGYVEGRNIRFEYRFADGTLDRLPMLAQELVRLNPSIIVSAPLPANMAIHDVTRSIPIVMATGADPVAFGLVKSMSRPGGNMTGLTNFAEELASKQLDVMRELLPHLARVATLINVTNPLHEIQLRQTQDAAAHAAVVLVPFEFHNPDDIEPAFMAFVRAQAEVLLVPPDVTFAAHQQRIIELAATSRLPAIYSNRNWVQGGGLMNYGPSRLENYYRAAIYVDKILKGANPAELPIERPTKIELVINLKTAKAIGLEVPASLLARADEVIE
jgi:putative ABC transport system substrate-binding protein